MLLSPYLCPWRTTWCHDDTMVWCKVPITLDACQDDWCNVGLRGSVLIVSFSGITGFVVFVLVDPIPYVPSSGLNLKAYDRPPVLLSAKINPFSLSMLPSVLQMGNTMSAAYNMTSIREPLKLLLVPSWRDDVTVSDTQLSPFMLCVYHALT